ncbi:MULTISPECIES: LCP family protein [Deinococcus]
MRRLAVPVLVVLAGFVALSAPAVPALLRYAALPRQAEGPVTVLLAGVTPRYQENAAVWPWPVAPEDFTFLTDTLILAQLWPNGTANLLSIPRDTWVNLPGQGWGKINGANVKGGPNLLVRAVQELTGVPVDA